MTDDINNTTDVNYDDEIMVLADAQSLEKACYIDGVVKYISYGLTVNGTATFENAVLSNNNKTITYKVKSYSGEWDDGPDDIVITNSKAFVVYPEDINGSGYKYFWTYKVDDLTNTKWVLNYLVDINNVTETQTFYINSITTIDDTSIYCTDFVLNVLDNVKFVSLNVPIIHEDARFYYYVNPNKTLFDADYLGWGEDYNKLLVYDGEGGLSSYDEYEVDTDNRTFTIIDGSDVKNSSLIDWLYSNATLLSAPEPVVEPTRKLTRLYVGAVATTSDNKCFRKLQTEQPISESLANTTWLVKKDFEGLNKYTAFKINGTSDLSKDGYIFEIPNFEKFSIGTDYFGFEHDDGMFGETYTYDTKGTAQTYSGGEGRYANNATDDFYRTFTIVDGEDVTNETLINWLKANATKSEVTLITFTISDTSYQAEEGMTWEDWCKSEYNTDGFYVAETFNAGTNVVTNGIWIVSYKGGSFSNMNTAKIIADYEYELTRGDAEN